MPVLPQPGQFSEFITPYLAKTIAGYATWDTT
jgi:hypothetical protein